MDFLAAFTFLTIVCFPFALYRHRELLRRASCDFRSDPQMESFVSECGTNLHYDECGRIVLASTSSGYWTLRTYEPRRPDGGYSTTPTAVRHKYSHLYQKASIRP